MEICPSILILFLIILILIYQRCSRKVTKLKEALPLHSTPQRPAASPMSESWEWCHHAAQMAIPTLSGVFTGKAIVVYLLMDRRPYFASRDGDDSGHICFYLISDTLSLPYIMAPADVTSTKRRRPRRNSLHFLWSKLRVKFWLWIPNVEISASCLYIWLEIPDFEAAQTIIHRRPERLGDILLFNC